MKRPKDVTRELLDEQALLEEHNRANNCAQTASSQLDDVRLRLRQRGVDPVTGIRMTEQGLERVAQRHLHRLHNRKLARNVRMYALLRVVLCWRYLKLMREKPL